MTIYNRATVTFYNGTGTLAPFVFHGWTGWISAVQNTGDTYQRLGQSGAGMQIVNQRGRPSSVCGWIGYANLTDAVKAATAWEGGECLTARVSDGFSRDLPRVRFTNCRARLTNARGPTDSGGQILYRVDCSADAEMLPST